MARTRRQITLQEQESGVPASPPQSLPTATRSTRAKRTTARSNTAAAPADPPTSTRGGPSVRGGRIGRAKRGGRGHAQPVTTTSHDEPESLAMDVDAPEASDSSTHVEAAVQASPANQIVFVDEEMEDREDMDVEPPGETQFPTGVSAHPVQVQDMSAHPVQEPSPPLERRESATSLLFREILGDSLQIPDPNPGPMNLPTIDNSLKVPSPKTVIPITSPSASKPIPQAPNPSELKIHCVPRDPEWSHSLLNVSMDFIRGSKDTDLSPQFAVLAVPSDIMASVFKHIEALAEPGSDLSKITTDHPVIRAIIQRDAGNRPQLPSWQSRQPPPTPGSTMKDGFVLRARRKRELREMKEEADKLKAENSKLRANAAEASLSTTQRTKISEAPKSVERPQRRTKVVPDPYTADGQLLLGRTKEIEVDEYGNAVNPADDPTLRSSKYIPNLVVMLSLGFNEIADVVEARQRTQLEEARRGANVVESPYVEEETPNTDGPALGGLFAESQDQVQPEQVPETPRARGWGLSSYLPSARSVTRYLPFSSRRAISTPQHQRSQIQHLAQTEPRVDAGNSHVPPDPDPDVADPVAGPDHPHRHRQSTSNQQRLLTKQQLEEEKRIKKMRAQLRREAEALEKQKKALEIAKKDLAEQRRLADIAQTPGQKRKRMPSPDVIPLPANGGFGMVDEYFIVESSSDDEADAQETPTKERPPKKARTSAPDDAIVGSQFRARPYTGTLFAHPDALRPRQDDNVFVESDEPGGHPAFDSTPPPGPTLTFKVPSPGSSDSDDEDDEQEQTNETTQKTSSSNVPPMRGILRNSSNQTQTRPIASSPSPSKTMAPPPRPNPAHAALPPATTMTPSSALEKARGKALKHLPKQPSTLRESSRLSTSTVNSDIGDEENVEEYDPAHPAIVPSPSKTPALGQPTTTAASTFEPPIIDFTAPIGFQHHVTQPSSEQSHEQQAIPNTSGKQAETMQETFASARADDVQSSGQQAILSKNQNEDTSDAVANMNAKVKADLDRYWEEHGDDYTLDDGYEEFEAALIAEEQKLVDGPNGFPYSQPQNIISAALDRIGADSLADRGIMTEVEDNWTPGDLERTEGDPAKGMKVFFNRLVKNGDIERELADRAIAIGVPPGVAEHFAGQEAMGPVAA